MTIWLPGGAAAVMTPFSGLFQASRRSLAFQFTAMRRSWAPCFGRLV